MITIKILDETAPLEAVILGTAESMGGVPKLEKTYDPKSKEHILAGTFPMEDDLVDEMEAVAKVLEKYDVKVYRPKTIRNLNQIFARDIAFVIDDKLVVPCVTPERKLESDGIDHITEKVENVLLPDEHERMEGGDIMPWRDHIFVGYSKAADFDKYTVSRTNEAAVAYLKKTFPNFTVKAFELNKSDDNPRENALHLDCCFQPVGKDKAVIYPAGFKNPEDAEFLINFFGRENVFEITKEEMYEMNSNFFSIGPEVVISDSSFTRLNDQFRKWGLTVEEVKYREAAKMEGLLRCSTMPLRRRYE
ncbi:dimethylarginine dimethylaminohydrolase family protein [Ekhidna sp.]|uniref:dimethylarginine dimethylaminohydrolase family protein n=1 Tax=Ekhidna sp. TaxID=2608089 RepID=UPI003C7EB590